MKWLDPRRLRDALLGAGLVLGVAACTWQGIKPDASGPRRLYISGHAAHVSDARIAAIAAPYLHASFFDVDIGGLKKALEAQPWLTGVNVSRHWPDGVVVHVAEHEPIARWGAKSVLAADGVVFTPAEQPRGLVQLGGADTAGLAVYHEYQSLSGILAGHGLKIAALSQDPRGAWTATLDNGLELRLGRAALAQRMQRFVEYGLVRNDARKAIAGAAYVDLRYSDGFAVGGTRTVRATTSVPTTQQEKLG